MYLEHFGLSVNPFSLSPKLDFLYQSETFGESMAHLIYGLDSQEAIVLVTGPIGTGKTMALQSFLSGLGPHYESALVTNTRVGAVELLKLMLEDLGVDFPPGVDKSDLLILFKNFLRESSAHGKTVLLIVDEAQNLEPEVLEELRLLTNLGQGDTQPVQIILAGQPELEDLVNRPDMAQIRQRIRIHYTLAPLNRAETEGYLAHRMRVAGCDREAFSKAAVDRIYQLSGGIPRIVNTLAGDALLSAFVAGHDRVSRDDVGGEGIGQSDTQPRQVAHSPRADSPRADSPRADRPRAEHPQPERPRADPTQVDPTNVEPPSAVSPVEKLTGGASIEPSSKERRSAGPAVMERPSARGRSRMPGILIIVLIVAGLAGSAYYARTTLTQFITTRIQGVEPDMTGVGTPLEGETGETLSDIPTVPVSPVSAAPETTALAVKDTAGAPSPSPVPVVAAVQYYIHVASFRDYDRALAFKKETNFGNGQTLVLTEKIKGVTWNRVFVGPFLTRPDAVAEANRLERTGVISYYAVKLIEAPK